MSELRDRAATSATAESELTANCAAAIVAYWGLRGRKVRAEAIRLGALGRSSPLPVFGVRSDLVNGLPSEDGTLREPKPAPPPAPRALAGKPPDARSTLGRVRIVMSRLPDGAALPLGEIRARAGVSHASAHAAIRDLEEAGLIVRGAQNYGRATWRRA